MRREWVDLSPSPDRIGRVNAWIEREDGRVLMAFVRRGAWTLPGGGVMPGESVGDAAVREAWEEAGATTQVCGEPFLLDADWGWCVPLRVLELQPSPEGRPVAWVNPHSLPWADDVQVRQVLHHLGQTPPALQFPPLVAQAQARAAELGFDRSCSLETGRLLRTLAAARPGGRFLELGSGVGVGAAWLLSGMDGAARLLTVENDPERARAAWNLLRPDARAEVLYGDGLDALPGGPFDLIFNDCALKKNPAHLDRMVSALNVGGLLLLDDLSPAGFLPPACYAGDPLREAVFTHPQLVCAEVQVARRECVILATRLT